MTDDQPDPNGERGRDVEDHFVWDYEFPDRLLEDNRERGLSKNDRRFLVTGETRKGTPSDAVRANTRTRIRKRIRETIIDFWLLNEYLDDYDRDLIFEGRDPMQDWELREGIKNTIQFFYLGLDDSDLMDFETALLSAVHDAERERADGPVLVETEFDVEVDEQFHVQEAYEKFREGAPLDPTEIGALLVTGHVTDPKEIVRLAHHARGHGMIPTSLSPLLAEQLTDVMGSGETAETVFSTVAHDPDAEMHMNWGPPETPIRSRDLFEWEPPDPDSRPATVDDLPNADLDDEAEGVEILDEEGEEAQRTQIGAILQQLSSELGEPITVGDKVVYEDGDKHSFGDDDDDASDTDDSPVDADQ